jgi:hypothetical protein
MQFRRQQIVLASTVIAALAAAPAAAQEPGSEAGATAVEVDGILRISDTEASTYDDGSASATVIGIGEEQVVGGTQEGPGENSGEILTTGEDNEQGHLTVGGWSATVEDDRSHAESSVVDGNLGGEEGISGTVLESESTATESGGSEAETTGVRVRLSDQLELELLHANTSSSGEGESYILAINGEQVFSSEQADGQCEIPADPLAHLLCLYAEATEGEGDLTGGNAGVLDFTALDENITGRTFDAEAAAAPGDDAFASAPAGEEEPQAAPGGDAVEPAGTLPRTGGGLFAGLAGLLALGAGEGLRRVGRR